MAAELRRFENLQALSAAAADELSTIIRESIAARGVAHVALSGGSTPKTIFGILAKRHAAGEPLPWDKIHLWWGDERAVPPDHADSNYRMTRENLLDHVPVDPANVHRILGEGPDHAANASAYEAALVAALGAPPVLDYVMLGMGPDGHTASLFPGSPALDEAKRFVVANPVNSPLTKGATTRITLTATALNAGRHIRFLVGGADKAEPLYQVLRGARAPHVYPAQLIAPARGGDLVWYVDEAAVAKVGSAT